MNMRALGWALTQSDWYPYNKRRLMHCRYQRCVCTEERPCEHTEKMWPSESQGEMVQDCGVGKA